MRVLQVLPALNSGGVERGTVEFARELVRQGHESWVLSNGGRLLEQLEADGSHHVQLPVHRKSLASLGQIRPVRRLLRELEPDIVHVRSRMPAWITWLAWRKLPARERPRLVSTFHSLYSVNAYSAIMGRAEHVIAISETVKQYIHENYSVDPQRITMIPRGVDTGQFYPARPDSQWLEELYRTYPQFRDRQLVLMPGRLTRWKGQMQFLEMMASLVQEAPRCHGVIAGDAEPGKAHYRAELENRCRELGIEDAVTFVGHRNDIDQFYRLAEIVCHLSTKPEPFGRTLTEALATNTKVVAFDAGGAAESLAACFPEGRVPAGDLVAFKERVGALLGKQVQISVPHELTLDYQFEATLGVYRQLLASRRRHP